VRRVFEVAYSSQSLVVGTDMLFFSPRSVAADCSDRIWGHADMNVHRDGVESWQVFQSVVSLWPQLGTEVSTTVVWPGSHRHTFDELMRAPGVAADCGQYVRLEKLEGQGPDGAWINERYVREARRVPIDAGSMVIWSSKLMHQGWSKGPRLAVPVCFEPRERRSQVAFNRKVRLCASGVPTTHWASLGIQHSLSLDEVRRGRRLSVGVAEDDLYLPILESMAPTSLMNPSACEHVVLPLCKALEESGDCDELLASQIGLHLRPEILELL
jgi:hypothetical protein